MKFFLIILLFTKLNFTLSQEKSKSMESGFDELKGLVEGLGKGDLSIITKGMKGKTKEDKQSKDCENYGAFQEFDDAIAEESKTMDEAALKAKQTELLEKELLKMECGKDIELPDEFATEKSQSDNKKKNDLNKETKSFGKSFREDQKGFSEALEKLSGNEDQQLSGIAKSFQGILGSGDEINNSQFKKQQEQFLDILSNSLIDLLTAQFKFLEAFNMKQNIAVTKKALEDLKKGKDGKIPFEQLETAIEISKENKVIIDNAIASNKTISEESKEIFSSGMEDYGRGTKKMVNVGYASKEYLANLDGFGMGMFGNLEGIIFLVENIPSLTKAFLDSTDNMIKYSNNNDIPVPEEISQVQKDKEARGFAAFN